MPDLLYDIIDLIASLIRFLGVAVLGLGLGWLTLDLLKKSTGWQLQVAVFLGLVCIIFGMTYLLAWGATGAFALGIGSAILFWGLPKKEKKEKEED